MTKTAVGRRLTERELKAWRAFLRAHSSVTRALENELVTAHDLSLPEYSVLVTLVEAPEHRLRMTELADRVLMSRSGLTRLVDRMQSDGMVDRFRCPGDARGMHAVLTDLGLQRLKESTGTHLRGVREHVTVKLTDEELDQLHALMSKLSCCERLAVGAGARVQIENGQDAL
ncbi:MAG: MarR family transcriptional regulator [Actinomycetota bacterium]